MPPESIIVCPFTVLIDGREKAPYSFDNLPTKGKDSGKRLIVRTDSMFLVTGDYTISGLEDQVAIERKSLEDLYSTLGQHRERFEREFERLQSFRFAAVVVEATWQEICRPQESRGSAWQSHLNPRSVWGTIFSWSQRYPAVHWYTMGSRRLAEIATFEVLERYWRERETATKALADSWRLPAMQDSQAARSS